MDGQDGIHSSYREYAYAPNYEPDVNYETSDMSYDNDERHSSVVAVNTRVSSRPGSQDPIRQHHQRRVASSQAIRSSHLPREQVYSPSVSRTALSRTHAQDYMEAQDQPAFISHYATGPSRASGSRLHRDQLNSPSVSRTVSSRVLAHDTMEEQVQHELRPQFTTGPSRASRSDLSRDQRNSSSVSRIVSTRLETLDSLHVLRPTEDSNNPNSSTPKELPYHYHEVETNILRIIAIEGAPYDSIQSSAFKNLIRMLDPLYKIPSSLALHEAMRARVHDLSSQVNDYLEQHVERGSITVDTWSSVDERWFLAITYHFLTHDYEPASLVIGLESISSTATAEMLCDRTEAALRHWGLHKKLVAITTDQGAIIKRSMVDCSAATNATWIPCAAHKIQLCFNKAWTLTPGVTHLLDKCQKISTFFRGHSVAMRALEQEQRKRMPGKKPLTLLASAETRWRSQFGMALRVLQLHACIVASCSNMKQGRGETAAKAKDLEAMLLSEHEVNTLQEIISVMKPAAVFSQWMSSSVNPSVSQLYTKLYSLLPRLDTLTTPEARELYEHLDNIIKDMWPPQDLPDAMLLAIYLNPAFVYHSMLDLAISREGEPIVTLRDKAKALVRDRITASLVDMATRAAGGSPLHTSTHAIFTLQGQLAVAVYEDVAAKLNDTVDQDVAMDQDETAMNEGETSQDKVAVQGVKATKQEIADAPQIFWRNVRKYELRDLVPIARQYLSIQATSIGCKKLFSSAEHLLSPQKTKFEDDSFKCAIHFRSLDKLASLYPYICEM